MSRLDEALDRATALLRMDGVIAVGGAVVGGEDVIQIQLDRPERDLTEQLPAEIDGVAVTVLEDRAFVVRGDRMVSTSQDALDLQQAQLAALREAITTGSASASDYERLLRMLIEAALADQPLADWNEIERIARIGVRAFPTSTTLLGHLLVLSARRGATREMATIAERISELDPDSELLGLLHGDPEIAGRVAEQRMRLSELLEAASGEDPRASAQAIDELERRSRAFPGDVELRATLAFGYLSTSRTADMLREAKQLAASAADSHEIHFNVAQLYAAGGRRRLARRHYRAAVRLARSEEDRDDALRGLAAL
jgi:hypothetical protein